MRKHFLIILLLLCSLVSHGQNPDSLQPNQEISSKESTSPTPLRFSKEKLRSFKEDPAYDYTEKLEKENWWTSFKRYISLQWNKFLEWLFGDTEFSPLLAFFLKSIPYLLVLFILALLVYIFSRMDLTESFLEAPGKSRITYDEEENIIRFQNIKKLIAMAVARKEYRLAVRYHFLYILQQLSFKGIVSYESSKTDEDYLNEIEKENLKLLFKKLNRIYDFVWYGHFETGVEVYQKIEKEFREMELLIKPNHE